MEERSVACLSYEPHVWRRNRCKNCFHSKTEHKRRSQQNGTKHNPVIDDSSLHLDFVDGTNLSDNENQNNSLFDLTDTNSRIKNEFKLLRRERKEIAGKQAELRETMLRMEMQMHDYKETKQENDILTKDIQLLKKDLREITIGASKACEINEKLQKEVSRLKKLVLNLGGDPKSLYNDDNELIEQKDQNLSDSEGHFEKNNVKSKKIKIIDPEEEEKRAESEPELKVNKVIKEERSQSLSSSLNIIQPIIKPPIDRNNRERIARMEDMLSSLRSVCISITNTPANVSIILIIFF